MVKLSIIVPVYNKAPYLDDCITSILNQTFTDFELILVNDGSTDGSYSICKKYKEQDDRIMLINQQNSGVSAARNAGLKMAAGNYIGFVDSDDTIDADMYALLYQNAICHDADISVCRMRLLLNGKLTHPPEDNTVQLFNHEKALELCLKGDFDRSANNKIYKSDVAKSINFSGRMYEDILYTCRAFIKNSKTVLQNTPKYNYIVRESSVSVSGFDLKYMETIQVSAQMIELISQRDQQVLPYAQAFDVLANISLLNLLLLSNRNAYVKQYAQVVDNLYKYDKFITSSPLVAKKHKYAYQLFKLSPGLYRRLMYAYCWITRSELINRV